MEEDRITFYFFGLLQKKKSEKEENVAIKMILLLRVYSWQKKNFLSRFLWLAVPLLMLFKQAAVSGWNNSMRKSSSSLGKKHHFLFIFEYKIFRKALAHTLHCHHHPKPEIYIDLMCNSCLRMCLYAEG